MPPAKFMRQCPFCDFFGFGLRQHILEIHPGKIKEYKERDEAIKTLLRLGILQ